MEKTINYQGKKYLKPSGAAEYTEIAKGTLANDRYLSRGLPYIKLKNGAVLYDVEAIDRYMESKTIRHEG